MGGVEGARVAFDGGGDLGAFVEKVEGAAVVGVAVGDVGEEGAHPALLVADDGGLGAFGGGVFGPGIDEGAPAAVGGEPEGCLIVDGGEFRAWGCLGDGAQKFALPGVGALLQVGGGEGVFEPNRW